MAKVELTPMKLACLKDAAECINPAHRSWYLNDYKRWVETYENGDAIIVCHPEQIQPALSFIAEADPATVLAMVEEIEQLTKTSQELFDKTKALEQEIEQIKRQAENNVKHVPYYTGKGPLEQAIEILGTRELNKVIQSRKKSEAGQ